MKYLFVGFLLLIPCLSFPNAAQPGFWDAGGTGTFSLLYPEDSAASALARATYHIIIIQMLRTIPLICRSISVARALNVIGIMVFVFLDIKSILLYDIYINFINSDRFVDMARANQ